MTILQKTKCYKFKAIYKFISVIYEFVFNVDTFPFYEFDEEAFAESATKFNKESLLHIFVISILYGYYQEDFHDNGDFYEDKLEWWKELLHEYDIQLKYPDFDFENESADVGEWYKQNGEAFLDFFKIISDEIVHILFDNMDFLVRFNQRMSEIVENNNIENDYNNKINFPKDRMKKDGTIRRCYIPKWVEMAVFYRDYGHCVFCGCDLTSTISTLNNSNYDHIVPLHKFGINDPCNIQLCCERCNKKKGGKELIPQYRYQKRW